MTVTYTPPEDLRRQLAHERLKYRIRQDFLCQRCRLHHLFRWEPPVAAKPVDVASFGGFQAQYEHELHCVFCSAALVRIMAEPSSVSILDVWSGQ